MKTIITHTHTHTQQFSCQLFCNAKILKNAFKIAFFLLTFLFGASPLFAQKNVAVLEIDRRPEVAEEISRGEAMEITGMIRGAAVRTLPHGRFNVMTSETVQAMGGAALAECFDETCVIALGRTIDAEYVMRGVLSKFRTVFTLNIEMFETEYGNLVATSAPVRSEDLMDLLNLSEFATVEMLETFLARSAPQTTQAARAVTEPIVPSTYTLTVRRAPQIGGTVSINPDLSRYESGTRVTLVATPAEGYSFSRWSGASRSLNDSVTITMNNDAMLTAFFQDLQQVPRRRVSESESSESKYKKSWGITGAFRNNFGSEYSSDWLGGGFNLFRDFAANHIELNLGMTFSNHSEEESWNNGNTSVNETFTLSLISFDIGLFGKYPIDFSTMALFPMIGIEYQLVLGYTLSSERTECSPSGCNSWNSNNFYDYYYPSDFSRLWIKFGSGLEIPINERTFIRSNVLYGIGFFNRLESSASIVTSHGFDIRAGIGFRF